jgi:hypothetical protein
LNALVDASFQAMPLTGGASGQWVERFLARK